MVQVERRSAWMWSLGILLLSAAVTGLSGNASPLHAQGKASLEPFAFLAGGTWEGTGRWPDGSAMRVQVRYFWGPTHRLLHFETWDLETGQRVPLYEGQIFFDPARAKFVQWNMKPTGELDVSEFDRIEPGRFEVNAPHTRSVVRQTGPDEFHWELRVPQGDTWQLILDATYRRMKGSSSEPIHMWLGAAIHHNAPPASNLARSRARQTIRIISVPGTLSYRRDSTSGCTADRVSADRTSHHRPG